jgi:glycosyltransferase involved in cell wall biosynthesis
MRILFLTQILPYPPNAGPRVKTWHVLRHLAKSGAYITLVTFIRPDEVNFINEVKKICFQVYSVPIERNRLKDLFYFIKSIISGKPFLIERDHIKDMDTQLQEILNHNFYDVIHADQLTMAQFALKARQISLEKNPGQIEKKPKLIFDAHNATWTIMDRMQNQVPFFLRPFVWLEKNKIKKYEGRLVNDFDATLAVTEIDREALLETVNHRHNAIHKINVVPIAVDTKEFTPLKPPVPGNRLVTLGTLHYPPNADGIRWFMQQVFPIILESIPDCTLTIIGKNPPKDFYEIAGKFNNSVSITGYVDHLEPYLQNANIMVVPVLAGGGMRVRILEAFARQLAVVTTTIGLEGIEAAPDQDVFIGDTPVLFADAVIKLLKNPSLLAATAAAGRHLVECKYDWQIVFLQLDNVYRQVVNLENSDNSKLILEMSEDVKN